ncbi:MAG: M20 family metallopeptidase [Terriglobales bacterium]
MAEPKKNELLRYLESRRGEMIATLRAMVEIESPSFNKQAVDRLGEMLAGEFEARGGRVKRHKTRDFGDHLEIEFRCSSEENPRPSQHRARLGPPGPVLLLGHMDTVWDLGTLKTMPFRQKSGRLHGPGVYDMKAGIAQMLFAIEALREVRGGLPRTVRVLLVTDEEVKSESSRDVLKKLAMKAAAVLVLEPSAGARGALKTARKGVGEYRVKITGCPSHAGLDPQKGHSAILELARQIERIAGFTDLKRGITVNPGVIRGGTRTNVVAAEAVVEVDARVSRMEDAPRLNRKFHALRPVDKICRIEISGGINRPPLERTPAVVNLFQQAKALAAELGIQVEEAAVGGGSDGNFTAAWGIPTLDGLGAVGEGAHAAYESVVVAEMARRTALLASLIESLVPSR